MDKRYQVFVSSTYEDLKEERQEVMQALLELDCIPCGMELFPAANEDQWTLIKGVIDDCDYYIVVIAGRYGSTGPKGISYTQMEYEYAIEHGKPVIAFLHKDPGAIPSKRTEQETHVREKLENFRTLVQNRMCKFWSSPAELGSVVSRSLIKLIRLHPAVGWVRGDLIPDQSTAEEILKLRKRVEELERELAEVTSQAPRGAEKLAQGDDTVMITFSLVLYDRYGSPAKYNGKVDITWNELFARVSPFMIDEISESRIKKELEDLIKEKARYTMPSRSMDSTKLRDLTISDADFQTIKVQLRALNLITKSKKHKSVKDQSTYWTLTPYGEGVMTRLRAVPRQTDSEQPQKANQIDQAQTSLSLWTDNE